jgi:hypothetical protein
MNIERFQNVHHTKSKGDKKAVKLEILIATLELR